MEMPLIPLKLWLRAGLWATLIHVAGALAIDYVVWRGGFAYEVMAGQLMLLLGGVWLLIVLAVVLFSLRRWGYLDPIRIILWVLGVSLSSAPLKALGERLMEPLLHEAYEAYPSRRATALRIYLKRQQVAPERIDEIIKTQTELFALYRERSRNLGWLIVSKLKVLGLLGGIYALILGLILRGGGTGQSPLPAARQSNVDNAGSS